MLLFFRQSLISVAVCNVEYRPSQTSIGNERLIQSGTIPIRRIKETVKNKLVQF